MSMRVCERCRGFVPEASRECPHCEGHGRTGAPSALKIGVLSLGASLALAIYIPGCAYGCPDPDCGGLPPVPDAAVVPDAPDHCALGCDAAPPEPDAVPAIPDAAP